MYLLPGVVFVTDILDFIFSQKKKNKIYFCMANFLTLNLVRTVYREYRNPTTVDQSTVYKETLHQ